MGSEYDGRHKRRRAQLLYNLRDGEECEVCARPMFRDKSRNWDGRPLEADHIDADTSKLAGRLIHSMCNKSIVHHWVRHGPGWFDKYGYSDLDVPGGRVIEW